MKIFYNRKETLPVLKDIVSLKNYPVEYKAPVDFVPIDGSINFGEHIFNFVISEDVVKGILAAAIWEEVIRKAFRYLKKNTKGSDDTLVITTDEHKTSKCKKTICFVFYVHQSEKEILRGLKKIQEARKRLLHLLKIVDVKTKNNTLRLTFSNGRWVIN